MVWNARVLICLLICLILQVHLTTSKPLPDLSTSLLKGKLPGKYRNHNNWPWLNYGWEDEYKDTSSASAAATNTPAVATNTPAAANTPASIANVGDAVKTLSPAVSTTAATAPPAVIQAAAAAPTTTTTTAAGFFEIQPSGDLRASTMIILPSQQLNPPAPAASSATGSASVPPFGNSTTVRFILRPWETKK
jgi:hypothetical protein